MNRQTSSASDSGATGTSAPARRANQRRRTRKDLLAAAARLLKQGRPPADMDEVAREAMVSRATAYRYFPTLESLLVEAPLDGAMPDAEQLFADDPSTDPLERIDKAEAAMHEMCYRNEAQLRLMLANSLSRRADGADGDPIPVRQNRRVPLIEAALAPARHRFTDAAYDRLCAALAMVFGTESMIVFADVLGADPTTARQTKRWTAKALVQAALDESAGR